MTTSVIVKTHDWPVQVVNVDKNPVTGETAHSEAGRVEPHSESKPHQFYCTDTRSLMVVELKKPA